MRDDRSEMGKVVVYRLDNATVLPCGRVITADNLVLPLFVHGVTSSLPQLGNNWDMTRHPSVLAPLAICPPRPVRLKLIELFSKNVYDRTAPVMWCFGTDHYALLSETQLITSEDNFHIDPDRLISLIDALLERPALSDAVEPTVVNMH